MTYTEGQAVEVQFPSASDLKSRVWPWWRGVVVVAGNLQGREVYHVRLDAGTIVTVGQVNIMRTVPELAGLFAQEATV